MAKLFSALKIVFVTSRFPYPIEKGDKLRAYHQLKYLHLRGHEIILISLFDTYIDAKDYEEIKKYTNKIFTFKQTKWNSFLSIIKHVWSDLPFSVSYFYNTTTHKKITAIIDTEKPDVIYNQLIRTTEYTKNISSPKVLDYMDSFSLGMEKRSNESKFSFAYNIEYKRLKDYESNIHEKFNRNIIISEKDKHSIFNHKINDIVIVPNGVDIDFFKTKNTTKKYDIAFIGNLGYYPNIMACKFLIEKIYPLLVVQKKDISILIAGARPTQEILSFANSNIAIEGWIEDIREAYDSSKIFVAPLFWGSGQQNKILEAMSMELTCITTSLVNEAINAENHKEILISNTAADFATLILDQLTKPSLGTKSRKFVSQNFSWAASIDILEQELISASTLK